MRSKGKAMLRRVQQGNGDVLRGIAKARLGRAVHSKGKALHGDAKATHSAVRHSKAEKKTERKELYEHLWGRFALQIDSLRKR
jgi:hypothetical protein